MSACLPTATRMYLQLLYKLEDKPVPETVQVAVPEGMSYSAIAHAVMMIQKSFDLGFKDFNHEVLHMVYGTGADFISASRTLVAEG